MKSARAALILRIPSSLHQRLKQEARRSDLSLNRHCQDLLAGRTKSAPTTRPTLHLGHYSSDSPRSLLLKELAAVAFELLGDHVEGFALFGSFARWQELERSDIDLLVVLNEGVTLDRDVYSRWQFGKISGREISPLFVHIPADGERIGGLWFEVALDGIVLYDRALRLSRFLSRVRTYIAGGGARRMITHGHPYWVHSGKPALDLPAE